MIIQLYIRNHHGLTIDSCKCNSQYMADYMRARYSRIYPDYVCKSIVQEVKPQLLTA